VPAKLLADENVPAKAVEALRAAGCDVLSIQEHAPGVSDAQVLRLAATQQRILITFDRDYGELIFRQNLAAGPSVIYFRDAPLTPSDVSDAVLALVASPDAIQGALVVVSRRSVRARRYPKIPP
jgi:predicted nuclease of predicted toxin-antitoxin system